MTAAAAGGQKAREPVPRLALRNLSKKFGGRSALRDVDLVVRPGEIHALVGQNGSGKSTLIKVLAGLHEPEHGASASVDGRGLRLPPTPSDLRAAGISFVHQDLGLVNDFSVAENICVGRFPTSSPGFISRRRQTTAARDVLDRLGVDIDPTTLVGELGAFQRAMVAIARGLLTQRPGRGVIVLDESTRALPQDSLAEVYSVLDRIRRGGGSVVMTSHNLEEVVRLADRVTVLRDGRVAAAGLTAGEATTAQIATAMLGYELEHHPARRKSNVGERSALTVAGLSGGALAGFDLDVRAGEIVGVTGLAGSGFEAVPYLLAGAAPAREGRLEIFGHPVPLKRATPGRMLDAGITLIPERRQREGLAVEMTVADNVTLPRLRRNGRPWWIGSTWRAREVDGVIRRLGVVPADPELTVRQLSGGNQQKILLGKWLAGEPEILLLHEPTQAVDVAARRDILLAIGAVADSGAGVVIASLEATDLATVCDRVIVVRAGRSAIELVAPDADTIIDEIYGAPGEARSDPTGVVR
jgi:ribose transport system ATP-binding protein